MTIQRHVKTNISYPQGNCCYFILDIDSKSCEVLKSQESSAGKRYSIIFVVLSPRQSTSLQPATGFLQAVCNAKIIKLSDNGNSTLI